MRKLTLSALMLCGILNFTQAQISHGGTPPSFNNNITKSAQLISMPEIDVERLMEEDAREAESGEKPFRFAYNHTVDLNNRDHGTWTELANGDRIWRLSIHAPEAYSLNFGFNEFHLPEGAQVFIYNENKSYVLGAFTSENHQDWGGLATTLIHDDFATIEYYEPANVKGEGRLSLERVSHGYKSLSNFAKSIRGYGDSGSCNMNINCPDGDLYQDDKRSVCMIMSGGSRMCTGALVNNTREDGTPYFLTANHCFSGSVTNWVYVFNYEAPTCTNADGSTSQSISGSTLRARNADTDFCLTEMSSTPPANYEPYYAGWDHTGNTPQSAVGIHHPSGDIKKISFDDDPLTTAAGLSSVANAEWQIEQWERGTTTEPGSSGSPLWNENHHLIGQLHGGQADCSNSINDYYGRFDWSWDRGGSASNQLKDWLDPDNTGVSVLDGYDPNAVTVALDASMLSIANPTSGTETCENQFTITAVLRNKGTSTLTSATIELLIDNASTQTINWTGSLATNLTEDITFNTVTLSEGTHDIEVVVSSPNGGTDLNTNNDNSTASVTVLSGTATGTFPVVEDFESAIPSEWSVENPDNNITFETYNGTGGFSASNNCIWIDFYSDGNNIAGQSDYLNLPSFNMNLSLATSISFDLAYAYYDATYNDSLIIEASVDCGATWERAWADGYETMATAGEQGSAWTPSSASDWKTVTVDLNDFNGNSNVKFRFHGKSGWGNNLYLDNINLTSTIGVDEENPIDVNIYPNPATNMIYFQANQNIERITFMDAMGRIISTQSVQQNIGSLDVSSFASGIYFLQMTSGTSTTTQRIEVK